MQYRRCTYYDDCAITSVFLFCKSEKLEEQKLAIKFTFSYFTFFFSVLSDAFGCRSYPDGTLGAADRRFVNEKIDI